MTQDNSRDSEELTEATIIEASEAGLLAISELSVATQLAADADYQSDIEIEIAQGKIDAMPEAVAPIVEDYVAQDTERAQGLARLQAVANPHHSEPLRLNRDTSVTKHSDKLQSVCSHTGIVIELTIPSIPNVVLDYYNPLAIYTNAKGLVEQGPAYLRLLDTQILAGLWLTCYRHYNLFVEQQESRQNSSILNAMLRTAGKQVLIDSLETFNHIHSNNARKLPSFSLNYETHAASTGLGAALQNYSRVCRAIIYPTITLQTPADKEYIDAYKTKPRKKLYSEREWEEGFKTDMREAKGLLNELADSMTLPVKLISFLKPLFVMKNTIITTLDPELRTKIVDKLKLYPAPQAQRLAAIIKTSANPYDIFGNVDQSLARASDDFKNVVTPVKRSLADILAAKQGKAVQSTQEPTQEGQDVLDVKGNITHHDLSAQEEIEDQLDRDDMIDEESSLSQSELGLLDSIEGEDNDF